MSNGECEIESFSLKLEMDEVKAPKGAGDLVKIIHQCKNLSKEVLSFGYIVFFYLTLLFLIIHIVIVSILVVCTNIQ